MRGYPLFLGRRPPFSVLICQFYPFYVANIQLFLQKYTFYIIFSAILVPFLRGHFSLADGVDSQEGDHCTLFCCVINNYMDLFTEVIKTI
jgi:hypothetical protein